MRRKRGIALLCLLAFATFSGAALFLWLFWDLPKLDTLTAYTSAPSSKIYDRRGRLLFEMPPPYTGSHSPVSLDEIAPVLVLATLATEDASFYSNPGMDARAILRSMWINIQGGEVLAGGSTITQQLVRIVMFSTEERFERTLRRKSRELVLAVRLTRRYTKDEILNLYLNEIYYGNMAYGVEAAAQAYYGKSALDLDLAEAALLAGLPQAPAFYNPLENLDAAKARQAVVLDLMLRQGYISAEDARMAKDEVLSFSAVPFSIRAPHAVMYVRGQLERELGLERLQAGGLVITTTIDVDLNEQARDLMRYRLELLAQCNHEPDCPPGGHNVRNAALLALDPWTGEVLAMVGSPDYFSARISGAVNGSTALRQPGSSIKPFTYAAAFEQGDMTAATMMLDVRTAFVTREGASYVPLNYDLAFRGPVRLREALASSYNLVAVKVLESIGIESLANMARRVGITTFDDPDRLGLALTLGGGEVRLLELTAAYAVFANGGHAIAPQVIQRVTDAQGDVLWESTPGLGPQVLDRRVAYLISSILSDDLARLSAFGEGSVLNLSGRPAAAKTGTTTDFHDNWTVGYTPDLVVGVWAGNADNEAMRDVSGIAGAAPLWHDFMEIALKGSPVREFERPPGLVDVEVCALSGLLPGPDCPHRVREVFIAGTEPREVCAMHVRVGDELYTLLPPEAQAWARDHNLPQPAGLEPAGSSPTLLLRAPDAGAVYRIDPAVVPEMQRIAVSAEASAGFESVTLLVDGEVLARFAVPPYEALWQLVPGEHAFSAEGITAAGELQTSERVAIEVHE